MTALSNAERMNHSHAKALRRTRELLKVTREELATRLGLSDKLIEKIENGREQITLARIDQIIQALNISREQYLKIKKGKGLGNSRSPKTVFFNSDRRSYKKIITPEVQALRALRESKGIPQDQASIICGYSRPTIGHIENGRIELGPERLRHIVRSYGHDCIEFSAFLKNVNEKGVLQMDCIKKIKSIDLDKLRTIKLLLDNF